MMAPTGLNIETSFVIAAFTMVLISQSWMASTIIVFRSPTHSFIISHSFAGPSVISTFSAVAPSR